jgi:hypothetical protein
MAAHKLPMLCQLNGAKFGKRSLLARGCNPPEPPVKGEA